MTRLKMYKVKQVSKMTGVSIRTLHYYDEIALLVPSERSRAGYRLYSDDDLLRLQQILIGRSLGLALEEIRRSLDDASFDYAHSLQRQKSLLIERLGQTHKMIAAIDNTLDHLGAPRSKSDLAAMFDGFDPRDYEQEVAARWGKTDAYRETARRSKAYTDADWALMKSELSQIWKDAALAMQQGETPESEKAFEIVERHREHVCRWFYDLSPQAHSSLADMWEADNRFRANIDKFGEGLTPWVASAVRAANETV